MGNHRRFRVHNRLFSVRRKLPAIVMAALVLLAASADAMPGSASMRSGAGQPAAVPAAARPGQPAAALPAVAAPDPSEPSFGGDARHKLRKKRTRAKAMSWVELQRRYPGTFMLGGPRTARRVALTFDDVPDPRYTPQVLDILARYHVRAAFFAVGYRAAKYPDLVRRIVREGHTIGNHSYNHAVLSRIPMDSFRQQVKQTDAVLRPLAGYSPRLLRPPYGEILPEQIDWLKRSGYVVVNWDVDSVDWRGIGSGEILANIQKTLRPGSIILQHAGGGVGQDLSGTLQALPKLIRLLRSKGYEIVPLPELLNVSEGRKTAVR